MADNSSAFPEKLKVAPVVAARRQRASVDTAPANHIVAPTEQEEIVDQPQPIKTVDQATHLQETQPETPRESALSKLQVDRSGRAERSARLKALQRKKTAENKVMMNVPLTPELRERLQKASFDFDVKMTKIMVEAIDVFLEDQGY